MLRPALALALLAASLTGHALAACQRAPQVFDLPAQRLDEALQQVAHITGCPVQVAPRLLADRRAPALKGRHTPEQALALLIQDTGYTAHATAQGLAIEAH